jgi:hypothetical protein
MLHDFITTYREAIIANTSERLSSRGWPSAKAQQLQYGVPVFLTQIAETLKFQTSATPSGPEAISATAVLHGCELMAMGFNLSEVVHSYGDICQAITHTALDHGAPIAVEEFVSLNRCLDTAIAEAVTEHARLTMQQLSARETQRLKQMVEEVSGILHDAIRMTQSADDAPAPGDPTAHCGPSAAVA